MGVNSFLQPNCGCCRITANVSGCNVTLSWASTGDSASIDGYGSVSLIDSMTISHLANSYTLRVVQCNGSEKTCTVLTPGCFLSGTKYDAATGVYSDFANYDNEDTSTRLCHIEPGVGTYYLTYTREQLTGATALNHSFGPYDFKPGDCNLVDGVGADLSFNTYLGAITHTYNQTWRFDPDSGGPSVFTDYECIRNWDAYSQINPSSFENDRPKIYLDATGVSSTGSGRNCDPSFGVSSCTDLDTSARWKSPFGFGPSDIASGGNASNAINFLTPGKFTWSLTPCS